MYQFTRRHFASQKSVCILANSRQADLIGSKLITNLRAVSGEDIAFTGYGGQWMKKEGFESTVEFDIGQFMDKTFTTYRKTKSFKEAIFFRWNSFNLVNKHFTRSTDHVYDQMMEADLPKRIYQSRPNLILNIDNEYMTFLLMDEIKKYYTNSAVEMPKRHYFNRFVKDFRQWTENYVDFMHYTVPLKTGLWDGYQFPGEYVGQYGVYDAVRHIYQKNSHLSHLINEDGSALHVSKRYFATDLEKGIENIRTEWREKNGIADDATIIFYAPGNEANEAEFTCENTRRGVKEFLLKYSAPTSLSPKARTLDNFVTVISVHSGSDGERYVREFLKNNEWYGKVVFVSNEDNEHLDALCAADLGIIYDGQMVSAAAACHLPTMNLIKMRMHHQWYHDLFNRWWNDMNIIADNNVYPEIIGGEAWFGKIADTLGEWYVKPDTRYNMIRKFDGFIQEGMSYKDINRSEVTSRDLILSDGQAYNVYQDPLRLAAENIWADIQKYELAVGTECQNLDALKFRVKPL